MQTFKCENADQEEESMDAVVVWGFFSFKS